MVLSGHLRKLKTMKKRWFVLYSGSPGHPAHLEYHDNDRKWRTGHPPSREVILENCLNICKKQDTRDSKNRHVIAIYTYEDCLSILFEDEQELQNWLINLLRLQKGLDGSAEDDGKIPRPKFENMWQVNVKGFRAEDEKNHFVMEGPHRLCVTADEIKFFPVGKNTDHSFQIISIRSTTCNDRMFELHAGRSSLSGAGTLFIHCDDKEISAKVNGAVMDAIEAKRQNPDKLPSNLQRSINRANRARDRQQHGGGGGDSSAAAVVGGTHHHHRHRGSVPSASSHHQRPRSESCSEIDKKSTVPKTLHHHHHHHHQQQQQHRHQHATASAGHQHHHHHGGASQSSTSSHHPATSHAGRLTGGRYR